MKKQIFFIFVIILFLSFLSFLLASFYLKENKQPQEQNETKNTISPVTPSPNFLLEITQEFEKELIFEKNLKEKVPEIYKKRLKIFRFDTKEEFGFEKEMIIFPFPITLGETLNIYLWTKEKLAHKIQKVEGIIKFKEREEYIGFFPLKTVRSEDSLERMWLGVKEQNEKVFPLGKFPLIIRAVLESGEILDEFNFFIEIKSSEEIFYKK